MKQYKKDTKFIVCSEAELIKKGWVLKHPGYYYHDDFPSDRGGAGPPISSAMVSLAGDTLTVLEKYTYTKNWYQVRENTWIWPVATFLEETTQNSISGCAILEHECKDGITPINGWVICKTCGKDLRQIK